MSVPALGHLSPLRIAKESTYATAPGTATAKYDVANFKFSPNLGVIEDPNQNSSGGSSRDIVPSVQFVTFSFDIRIGFGGCEELWRFLLPAYSSAIVDTSAVDHIHKEGPILNSYTIEDGSGNLPAGKVDQYVGCYCTGYSFQVEAGVIVLSVTASAAAVAENTTPMGGSPAVLNKLAISHHGHLLRTTGNLKDGSGLADTAIYLKRLGLTVVYPHTGAERNYGGSPWADSPVRNGPYTAVVEGTIQWDATNYVMMSKLTTNSPATGGLRFLWQHPTIIGAVSAKREFEIIASSPVAGGYEKSREGAGVIYQNFSWALAFNDTDQSFIKVRNRSTIAALV